MSQLLLQTLREAPAEARTPGYQLLLRGGFVRSVPQSTGGAAFAFLPMGASLRKRIEGVFLELLMSCGGQSISLPTVHAAEAGQGILDELPVRFRDRSQREMLFGAGHDATVLGIAVGLVRSYRQLPLLLLETWQQYRDSSGSIAAGGLLGAREGRLIDAYGLYRDPAELAKEYGTLRRVLSKPFASWDLGAYDVVCAEDADGRPVGHATIFPLADGDLTYARCPACGDAAETAVAHVKDEPEVHEDPLPMQDVETPDCKTIADLTRFLGISASRTAKAIFLVASSAGDADRFVFAIVRGDTGLNEARLKTALGADSVGPATEAEIRQAGAEPGYGSPVGLSGVTVIVDRLAARSPNLVAGANRPGYHTLNVNLSRDYQATLVADIATAQEGSPCPVCGSPLVLEQGVVLAEMRQAKDRLSRDLNAVYLDSSGASLPLALGHYRVYVDRVIAALAERHHDGNGFLWPSNAAPHHVHLLTVGKSSPEVSAAAERVYAELASAGITVLYDDRDERAGVKFNDADLLGAPWRVAVGERGLQSGMVEVKARNQGEVQVVTLDEVASFVGQVA